ncbi:hypothetical protein A2239_01430 [Candidatus Uhrbacteria bacterium RIFOXYA2_FULL_40_9]|nr:MAG: hypothetical protein UT94_C0028G0008 [Candidatus Uhrbacteria bacterium GW2011_GWF2_40_263]OGL94270.1 MAG: hypothetical protein A2239_01430 [Candidatus Uhrbacteria bacterium RIFOXYA2_FULL_40_9]OGL98315.1 MAG: hypothetical protein A2332_03745 [Candidatus Uhrbacteria bacterium RIFOXYB2_FULL_41_18]HBK34989.1 hypothetical protein [Candidatus Uhrbacteria bacterium]HCB56031.1 hypothetical protein [Candidatus Uhrbacteria bacterium]
MSLHPEHEGIICGIHLQPLHLCPKDCPTRDPLEQEEVSRAHRFEKEIQNEEEIKEILAKYPEDHIIGVLDSYFFGKPKLLTIGELRTQFSVYEEDEESSPFLLPFIIIDEHPTESFVEEYLAFDEQRKEEHRQNENKKTIQDNRKILEAYPDEKELLVSFDHLSGRLERMTAKEARRRLDVMEQYSTISYAEIDYEKEYYPVIEVYVIAEDPDEYLEEQAKELQTKQVSELKKMDGHEGSEIAWYLIYGDKLRNANPYKTTVDELRAKIFGYSVEKWIKARLDGWSNFPEVVSVGDPDFDGEYYLQAVGLKRLGATGSVETISQDLQAYVEFQTKLLEELQGLTDDEIVTLLTEKTNEPITLSVSKAREYIQQYPLPDFQTRGKLSLIHK